MLHRQALGIAGRRSDDDTASVERRSRGNAEKVHTVNIHFVFSHTLPKTWGPAEGPILGCPVHLHNQKILKYSKIVGELCNTDGGRQTVVEPQAAGGPYRSLARRCKHVTVKDTFKDCFADPLTIPTVDSVPPYARQLDGLLVWRQQFVEPVREPADFAFALQAILA